MKSFTSTKRFPVGTVGHDKNMLSVLLIEEDPKREGLYIMSWFDAEDGKKPKRFCNYFGKCNQAKIIELSKNMIEFTQR